MTIHTLEPTPETLHGFFSRDLAPVLTIDSGDTVRFRTLDCGWGAFEQRDIHKEIAKYQEWDRARDPGHALIGPVAVRGAKKGMTLEIRLNRIQPASWGWTTAGGWPSEPNKWMGLDKSPTVEMRWEIDNEAKLATNQFGHRVKTRPFPGVMGMPPDEPGMHPTPPPRYCGGNIDCKELIEGSRLFLPVSVDGALFSTGDGHAAQGDGEVASPALECPMENMELEFHLHPEMQLTNPRATTPAGWVTFGFDPDLNGAFAQALDEMLNLMGEFYGLSRPEAMALASIVVDFRVSQVVNGTKGVHGILPHGAIEGL